MSTEGIKGAKWLKPLTILAVAAALLVAFRFLPVTNWMRSVLLWMEALGPLGPLALIVLYVLACVLLVPGSILTLGAGFVFGVVRGSIYVSVASTLGAVTAFLVGRYLARDWVSGQIAGNARFEAVDRAVGKEGWKIVFLTRLSPVFPFTLLNYAYGVTTISLRSYFIASWIGMMPGTIMYVYLGSITGDLATLGNQESAKSPAQLAFAVVGLVATVIVTVYVTRLAGKALKASVDALAQD